jgi:ribose-phosphate pyrophosphokinase
MEVLSGSAHPELALEIAQELMIPQGPLTITRFPDGELHVRVDISVRGKDVFVIQPTSPPVNDNFTELLIILDALYRASARRITVVMPYYGYARQDKKVVGREPITARMIADMLTKGHADLMYRSII